MWRVISWGPSTHDIIKEPYAVTNTKILVVCTIAEANLITELLNKNEVVVDTREKAIIAICKWAVATGNHVKTDLMIDLLDRLTECGIKGLEKK